MAGSYEHGILEFNKSWVFFWLAERLLVFQERFGSMKLKHIYALILSVCFSFFFYIKFFLCTPHEQCPIVYHSYQLPSLKIQPHRALRTLCSLYEQKNISLYCQCDWRHRLPYSTYAMLAASQSVWFSAIFLKSRAGRACALGPLPGVSCSPR